MPVTKMGPKQAVSDEPLDLSMLPEKRDYRRFSSFCQEFLRVPAGFGAGDPFRLRPWQRNDVAKRLLPPTGRRPRQGLLSLPRGNGKSGLASALALYFLLADGVEGAQVLVVASDERQARIVYNSARRMIELEPRLREQVQLFSDRIYVPATDSSMFPLPAEPAALQGWNPSCVIVDELHVVTEPVWEAMSLASGKRPESLVLAISTPADRVDSVMWKLVEYGRANPDDKSFVYVEYSAPNGCALDDLEATKLANPALGDFLALDALEANRRTSTEAAYRRYRLGQWVGRADSWLPWGAWEKRADLERGTPGPGEKVCLAFDGSASGDSTALMGCTLDGHLFVIAIWQAPEENERWRVPRHEVSSMVASAFDRWDVQELAADPWGWRSELEEWARTHGERNVVEWNTAYGSRMGPATDRLYAAVMDGTVTHDGDETLAQHVANAVPKSTAVGDLITKDKRNSRRKIDAAVAAIVAHERAAYHRNNPKKSRRVVAFE